MAGGKKVYFSDTGLLNVIGRVNDGQLFENMIANQLDSYGELSFYKSEESIMRLDSSNIAVELLGSV